LTGAFDVLDADVALNSSSAGLDLTPINGSFILYVTGTQTSPPSRVATTLDVDLDGVGTDETLTSLAAKIDAVDNVSASVTADNRLQLTAADGHEITFGEDSSHVLAALGVNVFFTGSNSQDMAISQNLLSDSDLLAAATEHTAGDGSNAGLLAALATESLTGLSNQSITDFYNAIASNVAVQGSAALSGVESADAIVLSLSAQRESISGVSLDEETIEMLRFERAFQAAARYTSVVNQLVAEMLSIV
jgi:flagellar hook-associated protein 1 FlgK